MDDMSLAIAAIAAAEAAGDEEKRRELIKSVAPILRRLWVLWSYHPALAALCRRARLGEMISEKDVRLAVDTARIDAELAKTHNNRGSAEKNEVATEIGSKPISQRLAEWRQEVESASEEVKIVTPGPTPW